MSIIFIDLELDIRTSAKAIFSQIYTLKIFFSVFDNNVCDPYLSFSRNDVLMWLNDSLLPRLLDDSALLRDTGSVLLGTLRLRQIRDTQGKIEAWSLKLLGLTENLYPLWTNEKYISLYFFFVSLCLSFFQFYWVNCIQFFMCRITGTPAGVIIAISEHLCAELILFHVSIHLSMESDWLIDLVQL